MACQNCNGGASNCCNDCCEDLGNDCQKLHTFNNEYIKPLKCITDFVDVCDLPDLMGQFISKTWCLNDNIINNICDLWSVVTCIDEKTQHAVRVVDLWSGSYNVFDLPSIGISENLDQFDYLDLHLVFGTEHVVCRVSLEGGLGGVPTAVTMDKVSGNGNYSIAPGAIIAKEIGLSFPNQKTVKIDHFIRSVSGSSIPTLNETVAGVHIGFGDTPHTKSYCDSQDIPGDRPHKILKIEGIVSGNTGSCL